MNAEQIVRALETEVLCENCPHNESNCLDDGCYYIMAAALIDKLQALAENGQSAIDTNMRLVKVVESLQARLAEYDEIAAEYGIDGKTMLALAKSQIKTAQDNIKLREQLAALREKAERENGCGFCDEESDEHDYRNGVQSIGGTKYLVLETSEWDDYYDCYNDVRIPVIYCPMCGKRLEVEP